MSTAAQRKEQLVVLYYTANTAESQPIPALIMRGKQPMPVLIQRAWKCMEKRDRFFEKNRSLFSA